jgi:DNA polymerase III subunit epsilon
MQNLQLDRPLVCFDLETTGKDPQRDRIVQIALVRLEPGGGKIVYTTLVNPERSIPAGATAVHGITDADVLTAPCFRQILPDVQRLLVGADLAGFNLIRYDLPLLEQEVARAGDLLDLAGRRVIDAMTIFHRQEPRNLEAAVRFYCGRELEGAHSALADTEATLAVLDAQLARYADLPRDTASLHVYCNPDSGRFLDRSRKICWNDAGEAQLAFGKHQGKTLQQMASHPLDRTYLEWMLGSDFSAEVKAIIECALTGRFPRRD